MVFSFLFLTYRTQYDILQVHPCCCKWYYFIFFIAKQYSIIYIHTTSLSIHLLMDIYTIMYWLLWTLECIYLLNYSFVWIYTQEQDCWVIGQLYFQFFKESLYCSPQQLHQFTFPQRAYESFLFSTSSPTFVICRLCNAVQYEVIPHCCFDLHFSKHYQY